MYEATSRLDGIIVFSGFMLAVYRKRDFSGQLLNRTNKQQVRKKEKGRKGKGKRAGFVGSTEGSISIKYKKHKTCPKKLGAARRTHAPPLSTVRRMTKS